MTNYGSFSNPSNFWTNPIAAKDPKRNFRFKVSFGNNTIWWAKNVDQPVPTVSEATHDFLIHKFYWPSKVSWNEISMDMVDPVIPGTLDGLLATLQSSGYVIPENANTPFYSISKAGANKAFTDSTDMKIENIDADGVMIHQWTLKHAFIKEISPSKLDYGSEDLMTVTMKVRYDWAQYVSGNDTAGPNGVTSPLFQPRQTRP